MDKKRANYYLKVSNIEKVRELAISERRKISETMDFIIESYFKKREEQES